MAKILLKLGILLAFSCVSFATMAQSEVALATRGAELKALAQELKDRDKQDRQQVQSFAQALGIPVRRTLPNGKVLELQRIVPGVGPIFYITNNVGAADTVSTDEVWPGGSAGLSLDGNGMVVGEWDAGAVLTGHPDLYDRVTQMDVPEAISNHSTHVAGTLAGAGTALYPQARGMAYAAFLDAYDWNSDTAEMATAAANSMLLSNHSYGIAAGWINFGGAPPDGWWWIGGEGDEDPNFGYYDSEAQLWDQIAIDAPYYLPVKAAGNDRWDIGPDPGEEYTIVDQDGNPLSTSTQSRPADCGQTGYDCMPGNSVAKNVLTIGAVEDVPGGYPPLAGPSAVEMAGFSSWGPTDDGRIKPDVMGNGVLLLSTAVDSEGLPAYALGIGTSMAAPNVTGSLALLQEHYEDTNGAGNFMRAATLKALAIHTADETGDADGPDFEFGWGLFNTETAAQVISEDGGAHQIIEDSLSNGATDTVNINVAEPDQIVTATLVWTDPPGTPVDPAVSLDNTTPMLTNDLDLRIQGPSATHLPWILDPANPAAAATTGDNNRDNVEQVVIKGAGTGTYVIEVGHEGALDGGSQDYSLITSIDPSPPTSSGLLIDEDFSGGLPAGWSVEHIAGASWTINSPVRSNWRLDNGTGGSGKFAMVDVDYASYTDTALRTPSFDLSTAQNLILQFKHFFVFELLEDVYVDVSTDGGTNWTPVWTHCCFLEAGTQVVDLTGVAAGQSNFALRFRFKSNSDSVFGWGDLWQIDDVKLEKFGGSPPPDDPPSDLPGQASNPVPLDGATDVSIESDLTWIAGSGATSHDVYFGASTSPLPFQGNQTGTSFDPGTLEYSTIYYWRIGEVNDSGTTEGTEWSFTTEAAPQGPATDIHLGNLTSSSIPGSQNRWSAEVHVNVVDDLGDPVSGVLAEGSWSSGATGGGSCTTGSSGLCTVRKDNLKANVDSVVFTVNNLTGTNVAYQPTANEASNAITVFKDGGGGGNLLPDAVADSYTTTVDTPVSGNVMDNDDAGDAPASISSYDSASAQGGTVSMSGDGGFTYTPPAGFDGQDSFAYTIADNNGDSDSATVSVTVNPGGGLTLSISASRDRGVWYANLSWSGGSGTGLVTIYRDNTELTQIQNNEFYSDPLGKKPSGSYAYQVCEIDTGDCAIDTIQF